MADETITKDSPDSRYLPDFPEQILYPEYAIGQKLITREEYDQLETMYVTQAQAAFGLILPSLLLMFAIWYSGLLRLPWWSPLAIALFILVAVSVGMDRLHKFNSDLQELIVSRWDAAQDAKKAAEDAADAKHATDQANAKLLQAVKEEVDGLKRSMHELERMMRRWRRFEGLKMPPDQTPPEQTPGSEDQS